MNEFNGKQGHSHSNAVFSGDFIAPLFGFIASRGFVWLQSWNSLSIWWRGDNMSMLHIFGLYCRYIPLCPCFCPLIYAAALVWFRGGEIGNRVALAPGNYALYYRRARLYCFGPLLSVGVKSLFYRTLSWELAPVWQLYSGMSLLSKSARWIRTMRLIAGEFQYYPAFQLV